MPPCSQDAGLSGFLASWQLVWCDSNVYGAGGATFVLWDQGRPVTQSLAGIAGTKPLCSWLSMPSQMCPERQHPCHPSCCLPSFSQASWSDCTPEAGKAAVVSGVFSKGVPQAGMCMHKELFYTWCLDWGIMCYLACVSFLSRLLLLPWVILPVGIPCMPDRGLWWPFVSSCQSLEICMCNWRFLLHLQKVARNAVVMEKNGQMRGNICGHCFCTMLSSSCFVSQ